MPIVRPLLVEHLSYGEHDNPTDGCCVMEAAAYIAGEPHSDCPQCVCRTIGRMAVWLNDHLSDADRDRLLLPLLPKLVDTTSTPEVTRARQLALADWIYREFLPTWYDRVDALRPFAKQLRDSAPITETDGYVRIGVIVQAALHAAEAHMPILPTVVLNMNARMGEMGYHIVLSEARVSSEHEHSVAWIQLRSNMWRTLKFAAAGEVVGTARQLRESLVARISQLCDMKPAP